MPAEIRPRGARGGGRRGRTRRRAARGAAPTLSSSRATSGTPRTWPARPSTGARRGVRVLRAAARSSSRPVTTTSPARRVLRPGRPRGARDAVVAGNVVVFRTACVGDRSRSGAGRRDRDGPRVPLAPPWTRTSAARPPPARPASRSPLLLLHGSLESYPGADAPRGPKRTAPFSRRDELAAPDSPGRRSATTTTSPPRRAPGRACRRGATPGRPTGPRPRRDRPALLPEGDPRPGEGAGASRRCPPTPGRFSTSPSTGPITRPVPSREGRRPRLPRARAAPGRRPAHAHGDAADGARPVGAARPEHLKGATPTWRSAT